MKNTKFSTMVAAAIMSLGQASVAKAEGNFVPLESLRPEDRAAFQNDLCHLHKSVQIDWASVVVGVDENGKIVFRPRTSLMGGMGSQPTSFSMKQCDETE